MDKPLTDAELEAMLATCGEWFCVEADKGRRLIAELAAWRKAGRVAVERCESMGGAGWAFVAELRTLLPPQTEEPKS